MEPKLVGEIDWGGLDIPEAEQNEMLVRLIRVMGDDMRVAQMLA